MSHLLRHVVMARWLQELFTGAAIDGENFLAPIQLHTLVTQVYLDLFDLCPVESVPDERLPLEHVVELFANVYRANTGLLLYILRHDYILPKDVVADDFRSNDATENETSVHTDF